MNTSRDEDRETKLLLDHAFSLAPIDPALPERVLDRTVRRAPPPRTARRWLLGGGGWALAAAVVAALLVAGVVGLARVHRGASGPAADRSPATIASPTKKITFNGVQLTIPATWPVIDGAHARDTCTSTFFGQADRAFLGISYQGAPSCPAPVPPRHPAPADGVWMQPGSATPPVQTPTTQSTGQVVHLTGVPTDSAVTVWYHGVLVTIGIGANPAIEKAILDSITYTPAAADTAVLGRCPAPGPTPPVMPTPIRLTAPLVLDDHNGQMQPEPANVEPKVSAAVVWDRFFHDFGATATGAIEWSITFGSYSAQTPAEINPDGSTTPDYRGVPTWLIQGEAVQTDYGPCGPAVLAPYNADTGRSMGVTTHG